MDIDRILSSVPVNKQAAMVTSTITPEDDELKALQAQAQYLQVAIKTAKQHKHMSLQDVHGMGKELSEINLKISQMKKSKKERKRENLEFWFIDVCRKNMSKPAFDKYIQMAVEAMDKERKQSDDR